MSYVASVSDSPLPVYPLGVSGVASLVVAKAQVRGYAGSSHP